MYAMQLNWNPSTMANLGFQVRPNEVSGAPELGANRMPVLIAKRDATALTARSGAVNPSIATRYRGLKTRSANNAIGASIASVSLAIVARYALTCGQGTWRNWLRATSARVSWKPFLCA